MRIIKGIPIVMRAVFVMIKCELGKAYQVAEQAVEEIEQISEIYSTSGSYDLLAKFYVDDGTDVGRFVTEKVQILPGVKDTFTLITFNAFTPDKNPGGTRIA
jgi:DNA-binding Lrp family transcriptional regulator